MQQQYCSTPVYAGSSLAGRQPCARGAQQWHPGGERLQHGRDREDCLNFQASKGSVTLVVGGPHLPPDPSLPWVCIRACSLFPRPHHTSRSSSILPRDGSHALYDGITTAAYIRTPLAASAGGGGGRPSGRADWRCAAAATRASRRRRAARSGRRCGRHCNEVTAEGGRDGGMRWAMGGAPSRTQRSSLGFDWRLRGMWQVGAHPPASHRRGGGSRERVCSHRCVRREPRAGSPVCVTRVLYAMGTRLGPQSPPHLA